MNYTAATPQTTALSIRVGAVTEIGHREQNQDCMSGFSSPFGPVYLIADGMGGYRGGAEAAQLVAEAVNRHLSAAPPSSHSEDALTLAVRLANVEVLEKSKSGNPEFASMGSTIVLALVQQTAAGLELTTAHVGDSRAYLYRSGQLTLRTKDHTQVQWLIDNNAIDEVSARSHPDASVLTRALGHTTELEVDISPRIQLQEGDRVLLCSDGLSGFATAQDIAATLEHNPNPNACASELAQLALAAGSSDNVTVQVLSVGAATPSPAAVPTQRPAPDRSRTRGKIIRIVALVALLVIVAAGVVWWRRGHGPAKTAADPAQKVEGELNTLREGCNKLHENAETAQGTARDEKGKLEKLGSGAGKPDALKQEANRLKGVMSGLERDFEGFVKTAGTFEAGEANSEKKLAPLQSHAGQAPAADRQSQLDGLEKEIQGKQQDLDSTDKKFAAKQGELTTAQAEVKTLLGKWGEKSAPTKKADTKPPDGKASGAKAAENPAAQNKDTGSKDNTDNKENKDNQQNKNDNQNKPNDQNKENKDKQDNKADGPKPQ